ncbi:flagellar biosynthesis protein FlhF [Natronincola peptidivorans]|uniref:Flagellar biosynthesis protein FlhF n=1 Tax=Natronincola peptidivorans TaxID=426128 RepID=A0A1H9YFM3_9FIRM|nr:flagellar biosynthesis protein FlhF [Natronincola peptidivorans]SES67835.1 flagellar biosynthesis protein FlhF [Natronincola peptidivorans]
MKVKKFSASNNQEVMMKVRNELGPDAIIIHQRKIKPKGLLGFLKKPMIEVVAAKEDEKPIRPLMANNENESVEKIFKMTVDNMKNDKVEKTTIDKEVDEIKGMLTTVISKINKQELPDLIKTIENQEISKLFHVLKEQEVDEILIEEILQKCISIQKNNAEEEHQNELIKREITKIINKYIIAYKRNANSKIMVFMGPTGVGKTTTIAKLAAHYALNEGKTVGLISADTYRIAAVEQLKTYSDILNIPLEVIYNPSEIHYAVNQLNDRDIIMVDTAGRSHKNESQILELKKLLNEIDEKETYLVISCTCKSNDIKEIISTYSFINNYNIILTKIDEATTFGTIINIAKETKKPICYLTTGQSVPDDIEKTNVDKIVSLLMKEAKQ